MEKERIIPIDYAPNTVLVHENTAVFINIAGQGINQYISNDKVPVQKLCCINEKKQRVNNI